MTTISVIVPAYNAADTIDETLRLLAAQDFDGDYDVVVVDDGSEDDTVQRARAAPGARVISGRWGGPGPARNAGVEASRGTLIAFTDADCQPTSSWLREGVEALADLDLVQGRVLPDPRVSLRPFDRTIWVERETGFYQCANLFLRRDLFERLSGFEDWLDARIGKPLAEDTWLGWRARRAGARTGYRESALVHHAVFERSAGEYVRERLRYSYFPVLVRQMPELRDHFFYCRWFMSKRSASFDLAVTALAITASRGSRWPVLATAPYGRHLLRTARGWGGRSPRVLLTHVAADAVGLGALIVGSVRSRRIVL